MPKRVPLQSITVVRDDAAMTPLIGEPFDFTDDEIAQVEKMNPAALGVVAKVDVTKDAEPAAKKGKAAKADGDI